jgi:hypothetical protein
VAHVRRAYLANLPDGSQSFACLSRDDAVVIRLRHSQILVMMF